MCSRVCEVAIYLACTERARAGLSRGVPSCARATVERGGESLRDDSAMRLPCFEDGSKDYYQYS